ncbi:MAG: MTH1187 family thiamine-binding protein [Acidobacteriota bacterium]|nr:MTH1187 family thiamine-binding protein [Acidobacteriota bacterium]
MLVELSITPLGGDAHTSDELAEVLPLVDESGLAYQLTPTATCIEGAWDEVMPLIKRCHERVREMSTRVVTTIKIEDEEGAIGKLISNIRSVEEKLGRKLGRAEAIAPTKAGTEASVAAE